MTDDNSRKINLLLRGYTGGSHSGGTYTFDILDPQGRPTGEQAFLTGEHPLDKIGSAAQTYALALPVRQATSRRKANALPKGSGGVRCVFCQAQAAAKGDGSPITLKHLPACPEFHHPNRGYHEVRRFLVVLYWHAERLTEDLIIEAPGWDSARSLLPQILERDYAPGWSIISVSQTQ